MIDNPGGAYEVRSHTTSGNHSNQCIFDEEGVLMRDIPAAGTADYRPCPNPPFCSDHYFHDVRPFELSHKLGRILITTKLDLLIMRGKSMQNFISVLVIVLGTMSLWWHKAVINMFKGFQILDISLFLLLATAASFWGVSIFFLSKNNR